MKKVFLILLFLFLFPQKTFAESIDSFHSQIVAKKDGSMAITESIIYDFGSEAKHGIFRFIPTATPVGDLIRLSTYTFQSVTRDGKEEQFSQSDNGNQVSIKIGSPDKTIAGMHTYTIQYLVQNGIGSNYEDHDEIYWNITGNEWPVGIDQVTADIQVEGNTKPTKAICFTGTKGSTDAQCTVSAQLTHFETTQPLFAKEGLTVVLSYPVGTFPKSLLTQAPPEPKNETGEFLSWYFSVPILLINFLLAPAVLVWYFLKKRKNRFGKLIPNFDLPKDAKGKRITPAEAGAIDTAKLEKDDVIATIFDLAIRKYIKLMGIKEDKKILGFIPNSKQDYKIVKLKEYEDVLPFEKTLLDRLFEDGDEVLISDLKIDFYSTFEDMDKDIFTLLVTKKLYTRNPKLMKGLLQFLGVLSLFSVNLLLGGVFFYLSKKLNGRTQAGDEVDFRIDGLKLFLKQMDRNYQWQAEQLYIVEKMIPYAIALGYIDKFMEQLQIIKPDYHPTWYGGYGSFYNVTPLMIGSFNSNIKTAAPSSSSGFSGGSSGGGGGGGGGGSW